MSLLKRLTVRDERIKKLEAENKRIKNAVTEVIAKVENKGINYFDHEIARDLRVALDGNNTIKEVKTNERV